MEGGELLTLVDIDEVHKLTAANAELIERLRERTESHLAASARDVQTIQRQAIMLERFAKALEFYALGNHIGTETSDGSGDLWVSGGEDGKLARSALSAYESANLEPVANPIDEAVKRMEAVPWRELERLWDEAPVDESGEETLANAYEAVRARLIQAAKSSLG